MRHTTIAIQLAALMLLGACKGSPPAPTPAPALDEPAQVDPWAGKPSMSLHPHAVLRPRFMVGKTPLQAGTAFVIQATGHGPLLITAHHLFGPSGGLERTIAWQDMPREVSSVRATSIEDEAVVVSGGAALAVEGAEGMSETSVRGDLAIFPVKELGGAKPLDLAVTAPKVGDRVTLIAAVLGGGSAIRHHATVAIVGPDFVNYVFDTPIELRATSGAPVVDADDRVVAINLGGGNLDDGRVVGTGCSVAVFGPAIQRALAMAAARR